METELQTQPVPAPEPAPIVNDDPFAVDDAKFAILSPEQRATVEPILTEWKTRAKAELEKTGKTYEEKYKPIQEQAVALQGLVKDPRFQTWWNGLQQQAMQQNPQGAGAIAQTKPQDFATAQEWQQAVLEASNGDSNRMQQIQQRAFTMMATPVVNQIRQGQEEIKTMFEMKDLFERHPEAKALDAIGRDPKNSDDRSLSHLEMWLNWATDNGKPLEEGFQMAKKMYDQSRLGAQQEAMGMVQEKKASVTSGPSTNKGGQAVVEVADLDELMTKKMEYSLAGQTAPKFVIRQAEASPPSRWAQRA